MDPHKVAPGTCGCGVSDDDSDKDGVLDCLDACPRDTSRAEAGACGCGVPADAPLCLVHRYSFDDPKGATDATDSVGGALGTIVNTSAAGDGTLVLSGGATDQYVELPSSIVSSLGDSVTIEAWVVWSGAGVLWQRIFDFGSGDGQAGQRGRGVTYLFLSPFADAAGMMRAALTTGGRDHESRADASGPLSGNGGSTFTHVAVVIDGRADTMTLYRDGSVAASTALHGTKLSLVNDVNNWIGRSQYEADPAFAGVVTEFRIYGAARTAAQIRAATSAGPDVLPPQ